MVQVDSGPGRPDIERDKESLPAVIQQVKEKKGEQEQEWVRDNCGVLEREWSGVWDKKAASIGCKKSGVRKKQRGKSGE